MRVAIDAQQTVGTATGIGEYVSGLLEALPQAGIEPVALRLGGYDPWRFDRRVVWDQALLPLAALRSGARLLHCTSGSIPVAAPLPVVVTVHDVAWLRTQEHARRYARWYFGRFSARLWRSASAVIVDSAFSRDELLACVDVAPERLAIVHPGVDPAFGRLRRAAALDQPFLLAVGTVERRKNLAVAIEALAGIPGVRLVCAGPPTPYQDECAALARRLGVADRVEFRGYIARDALLELYTRAAVAVVPSRYEGFGYAAAQALCAGVPLVAARSSSLIEVAEGHAPLVDPEDALAWRAAIAATLDEGASAQERAAAQRSAALARFDWARCAAATAAVYRGALERTPASGPYAASRGSRS